MAHLCRREDQNLMINRRKHFLILTALAAEVMDRGGDEWALSVSQCAVEALDLSLASMHKRGIALLDQLVTGNARYLLRAVHELCGEVAAADRPDRWVCEGLGGQMARRNVMH